ncbi:MAG: carbohydrate ABC transporter permease [Spirochaetaceae bacterium]
MALETYADKQARYITGGVIATAALLWLFPFVWTIVSSLKTPAEISSYVWSLPSGFHWDNYVRAFSTLNYTRTLANTLFVAGSTAVLQCITGTLAAYAFARMEFPGRDFFFMATLATLMIPGTLIITGNFLVLRQLGWIDTFYALIIPASASGFAIFLFRQFFKTLPDELEHAARIDGAGRIRFLLYILLPLSKPALTTVFVFTFIGSYNQFLWPLIMTRSMDVRVIQIQLSRVQSAYGVDAAAVAMAASVLVLAPTIIIFMFLQRAFVRGIARTGIQ